MSDLEKAIRKVENCNDEGVIPAEIYVIPVVAAARAHLSCGTITDEMVERLADALDNGVKPGPFEWRKAEAHRLLEAALGTEGTE